jgi:hypothetical protein
MIRRSLVTAVFVLVGVTATGMQHPHVSKEPVLIADGFYWAGSEGNLGVRITGKFHSEELLIATFDLAAEIGEFKSKKYPFRPTPWTLRDILVLADFNGSGSVATWQVSGPRPLIEAYLASMKRRYEDRSLFYDFGYSEVNFQPSRD